MKGVSIWGTSNNIPSQQYGPYGAASIPAQFQFQVSSPPCLPACCARSSKESKIQKKTLLLQSCVDVAVWGKQTTATLSPNFFKVLPFRIPQDQKCKFHAKSKTKNSKLRDQKHPHEVELFPTNAHARVIWSCCWRYDRPPGIRCEPARFIHDCVSSLHFHPFASSCHARSFRRNLLFVHAPKSERNRCLFARKKPNRKRRSGYRRLSVGNAIWRNEIVGHSPSLFLAAFFLSLFSLLP